MLFGLSFHIESFFDNISPGFLRSVAHSFIIIRALASHSIILENDLEISKKGREGKGEKEQMHAFTSLSNRREEQDMSICINGRITKKKEKRKRRICLLVYSSFIYVCVYMYVCVCVCDIGKIRIIY